MHYRTRSGNSSTGAERPVDEQGHTRARACQSSMQYRPLSHTRLDLPALGDQPRESAGELGRSVGRHGSLEPTRVRVGDQGWKSRGDPMAGTELDRLARIYPGAIGRGVIEGSPHIVRSELRRWERRGEVIGLWHHGRIERKTGVTRIPYVRLKTRQEVARKHAVRVGALIGGGVLFAGSVFWAAWQVRYLIVGATGMFALVMLGFWLAPHWSRGCPGLHCSGCRG